MGEGWTSALASGVSNLPWGSIGKGAMFVAPKALQMFPGYSPAARLGGALNPIADYTMLEYLTAPERERAKAIQDEERDIRKRSARLQELNLMRGMGIGPLSSSQPTQPGEFTESILDRPVRFGEIPKFNPDVFLKALTSGTPISSMEGFGGTEEQRAAIMPAIMQYNQWLEQKQGRETQAKGLEALGRPDWSGGAGQEAYVKPPISPAQAQYGAGEIRAGRTLPAQVSESLWQQLGEGQDPFKRLAEIKEKLGSDMTATVPLGTGPHAGQVSIKPRSQEEVTSVETAKNTASRVLANPTEVQRIQARPGGTVLLGLLQGAAKGNIAAFNTVATALLAPDAAPADEFSRLIAPYLQAGATEEQKAFAGQAILDRISVLRGKGRTNLNQEGQLVQSALNVTAPGPMRDALILDLNEILAESRLIRSGRQSTAAGKYIHPEDQAILDLSDREQWSPERTRAELEKSRSKRSAGGAP